MSDWVFAGLAVTMLGAFLAWTAVHAAREGVNFHRSPGLRTPKTLQSSAHWMAAHRRIGPTLWRTGLLTGFVGSAAVVWGVMDGRGSADAFAVALAVLFSPVAWRVWRSGESAAEAVDQC